VNAETAVKLGKWTSAASFYLPASRGNFEAITTAFDLVLYLAILPVVNAKN
jgi:hypothetical protein